MTDILLGDVAALEATVRSAAAGDEPAFARLVAEHHAARTLVRPGATVGRLRALSIC